MTQISFPRQQARTRRFTLGVPRSFAISGDGNVVLFLRSRSGTDGETCLYRYDASLATESLLLDPASLGTAADVPPEERARRERARETSEGIVRFTVDDAFDTVAFDLAGHLFAVDLRTGKPRELAATGPVVDPRIDPTGRFVAYVSNGALRVVSLAAGAEGTDRLLAEPEAPDVTYGLAEFVAAEEMDRLAGYWWAPEGSQLLVARADSSGVARRYIADPANPERPPTEWAYPAAGTANAEVGLHVIGLDGGRVEVSWDRAGYEYLVAAEWSSHGLLIVVQSRDQRRIQVLSVDPGTGTTSVIREDSDDLWVDIVEGVPGRLEDGRLVWSIDADGAKRLVVGDAVVSGPDLQVRKICGIDKNTVWFLGSRDVIETELFRWSDSQVVRIGPAGGVTQAVTRGGTTVTTRSTLQALGRVVTVHRASGVSTIIDSHAETPVVDPKPLMRRYGEIRTAVLLPAGHEPGTKLPVLMDPYGGPHGQMVVDSAMAFAGSQWFADQGFAVIVADGRGTPGHGPAWDRAVRGDLATRVLDDQVSALQAAAREFPDIDTTRVAIRGWSFGGYLSALAVLRRPDVFHVAVAGAPVTEFRLYDTHYTERYLGHPDQEPENYERSSLLGDASKLERPLMLIHGMADDNVAVANTLQLSGALLAAGKPHTVLPLSGVTHMTPQEVVAENLMLLQLQFILAALTH